MKMFLAVYTGTPESTDKKGWNTLSEADRKAREKRGVEAWKKWSEANASSIIDGGSPLGKTKCASERGIENTKNSLCAYVILKAESHEAAVKLFENHPHFTIFPGDAVEVMECLPLPEM